MDFKAILFLLVLAALAFWFLDKKLGAMDNPLPGIEKSR